MKLYILFLSICFLIISCASPQINDYEVWSSYETPDVFKLGEPWAFIIIDNKGEIKERLTIKFTDKIAKTCTYDEWKKIEITSQFPRMSKQFLGEPAYYLRGSALIIDISANLCDAGNELRGQLKETGITGEYRHVHMFGEEVGGVFYGIPVSSGN